MCSQADDPSTYDPLDEVRARMEAHCASCSDYERGRAAALAEVRAEVRARPHLICGCRTVDCPRIDAVLALLDAPAPSEPGLDVETLTEAMSDAFTYGEPFCDDIEGFWRPFAAKVAARLRGEQR